MECIEARALKSSFLSETAIHPVTFDDIWAFNTLPSDDFSVDDLLDLSDKEFNHQDDEDMDSLHSDASNSASSTVSSADLPQFPAGELAVPVDDLENLEWLSQFVEDSPTDLSLLCPARIQKPGNPVIKTSVLNCNVLCLPSPVPKKNRAKRTRRAGGTWPLGPLSGTEQISSSEDSSYTPSDFMSPAQVMESFFAAWKSPAAKKQKKSPASSIWSGPQVQRRCTHCHVQKTPQWRTGPLGPKTLCNACGVRFKSGRLYPEYRPACSPTFSGDVHSNSHRKVLEMRRRKETDEPDSSGAEGACLGSEEMV